MSGRWLFFPSSSAYAANPVNFDGTNDYLTISAPLTGIADGNIILFSGWGKTPASTVSERRIFSILAGTSSRFTVNIDSASGALRITGRNSSGTVVLDALGPDIDTNNWRHIAISIALASTSTRSVILDGTDVTSGMTWTTYNTAGVMDLNPSTSPVCVVGRYQAANPNLWNGDMADLYFATPSSYYDLTNGANLAKFISAGKPVHPSNWPTDGAHVGLTGPTDTWHENTLGDDFTENGALTNGTGPVQV